MASQMKQIKAIKDAIKKEDINELRSLAIKHGFINDKLRKKAWPLVLGIKTIQKRKTPNDITANMNININNNSNNKNTLEESQKCNKLLSIPSLKIDTKLPEISESKTDSVSNIAIINENSTNNNNYNNNKICGDLTPEYQQIEKDISRSSLAYYNMKKGKSKSEASLSKILHLIFDDNDEMHYIQGFNDVTSVFYAVCNNEKLAQRITERVAKTLLKDYIFIDNNNKNDNLNIRSYKLIFDIIECHDSKLNKLFINSTATTNGTMATNGTHDFISVSISWLITWFAHNITNINIISRIYDYCLCSNDKLISSYLCAALIIYLKNDLYSLPEKELTLFEYFNDLPWNKLNFDKIIHLSQSLYVKYSNDLNKKFKQFSETMIKSDSNSNSESTDSPPVPITPYTPWTPYNRSQNNTQNSTPTNTAQNQITEYDSPFESIDFNLLGGQQVDDNNNNDNNNNRQTSRPSSARNITKKELKKKLKGFIDDYFGTYNENH